VAVLQRKPERKRARQLATVTVIAAVGSMVLGCVVALSRWRAQFGTGGIATVALGLIVLAVLFASDEPYASYATFSRVLTPVLLVIGIAAAVAALSSIGSTLAERSETPAVLAGLTTASSLGTIAVIAHFSLHKPAGKASLAGLLPPAAGAMFVAAALIGIIAARARREDPNG
jgi:hypothetical protein